MQLFTQTFQNISYNYIPHETISYPSWIDAKIKRLFLLKNFGFNKYSQDKSNADPFKKFQSP